jgi:hypothetical protein
MATVFWTLAALAVALIATVAYVLYIELRNQHHMWHDSCITPDATREDFRYALCCFRRVFAGKGITWWLDYGTLLGAWRIGGELPFDHDLDICYLGSHELLVRACVPELAALGIELNMERTSIFYRGRKLGDAEPWGRFGDKLCRDDPALRKDVSKFWRPLRDDFPAAWIDPLWSIRSGGEFYPCPNRPDRFLRHRYLTCRIHLRLVIPGRQKCWFSAAFWREALRIWRCRDVLDDHGCVAAGRVADRK